jgi:orotate phosphoribosyltransferase
MTKEEVLKLFKETGALLEGHFQLSSGLHSPQYFQCAKVLQYPHHAEVLCQEIAQHFEGKNVEVVISPALGGIVVGQEVARQLGARSIFAERAEGVLQLRRGFEITLGERVLACEDVVTTGGSIGEVLDIVRKRGGSIVGASCIVDRTTGKTGGDQGEQLFSLLKMDVVTYKPAQCPLCQQNKPLVKPGSRSV